MTRSLPRRWHSTVRCSRAEAGARTETAPARSAMPRSRWRTPGPSGSGGGPRTPGRTRDTPSGRCGASPRSAGAIVIVALGTGATTCVFGLLDALVVRSLPVERPDRLVWFKDPAFSYPIFANVHDNLPIFDGVFGWNID